MKLSLNQSHIDGALAKLKDSKNGCLDAPSWEATARQPVHTVYGGAHLFKAETAQKFGAIALKSLDEYAPDFVRLASALQLPGYEKLPGSSTEIEELIVAHEKQDADHENDESAYEDESFRLYTIYTRVRKKLLSEPVEDYRIDFEDGYGARRDSEEDGHCLNAAIEVARGMQSGTLPPFLGIRIKSLSSTRAARAFRTLDLFITSLLEKTGGVLPANFVVTLPKVTFAHQVACLASAMEALECVHKLPPSSLKIELMVETAAAIVNEVGQIALPILVKAGAGRVTAVHFGAYDYTSSVGIVANRQSMRHPACDFARHIMQVSLAGSGVFLSDGATNIMPIGPHKKSESGTLSASQLAENTDFVQRAWRTSFDHISHSLSSGIYQGWDLHPAQLPVRYAAIYDFFLAGLSQTSRRLRGFLDKAAQASLVGDVFDDEATGQGLLNYFLRGIACGALTESEIRRSGFSLDELKTRSFEKIVQSRRSLG